MANPRIEQCMAAILNALEADSESGALVPPILTYQRFPERGARYPLALIEVESETPSEKAVENFSANLRLILHISMVNVQEIPTEAAVLAHAVRKRIEAEPGNFGGCDLFLRGIEYSRWKFMDEATKTVTPITEVVLLYRAVYHEQA